KRLSPRTRWLSAPRMPPGYWRRRADIVHEPKSAKQHGTFLKRVKHPESRAIEALRTDCCHAWKLATAQTVLEEFGRATVEQAEAIATMLNERIAAIAKAAGDRPKAIVAELTGLRAAARNLARFSAEGNDSHTVRTELSETEMRIAALDNEA